MAALAQALQDNCHNPTQKATSDEVRADLGLTPEGTEQEEHGPRDQENQDEDVHAPGSTRYWSSLFAAFSALAAW